MTITVSSSNGTASASGATPGTSLAITTSGNTPVDSTALVGFVLRDSGNTAAPAFSDTGSNTWEEGGRASSGTGITEGTIGVALNIASQINSGAAAITITGLPNVSDNDRGAMAIYLTSDDPLDYSTEIEIASGSSTATFASGSFTVEQDCTLIALTCIAGTSTDIFTEDSNWTSVGADFGTATAGTTGRTGRIAKRDVSAGTYSYSPTNNSARNYAQVILAFFEVPPGGVTLTVDEGTLTLTGQAVGLHRNLAVAKGDLTLAGQAIGLPRKAVLAKGDLTLAGQDVTLTATGGGSQTLTVDEGTLSLAGQTIGLHIKCAVAKADLSLAGQSVQFDRFMAIAKGDLVLTGQDVGLEAEVSIEIDVEHATLRLIGQEVSLRNSGDTGSLGGGGWLSLPHESTEDRKARIKKRRIELGILPEEVKEQLAEVVQEAVVISLQPQIDKQALAQKKAEYAALVRAELQDAYAKEITRLWLEQLNLEMQAQEDFLLLSA